MFLGRITNTSHAEMDGRMFPFLNKQRVLVIYRRFSIIHDFTARS